ncbi:hypothetical protein FKW77_000585 [Venturia effusa]|uniref:Uncharacterized protein n=1 Tax=Venturia effusa TaxID=50376 RepID=A0A517LQG5_9PEZI|nr:hypothetical protein FKW77_000585 [Venturia effusa]
MASRLLTRIATAQPSTLGAHTFAARRAFSQSSRRLAGEAAVLPARKPVGAFRGGLLGFLSGSFLAAGGMYFYVLQEYRVSNELLTEDIYVHPLLPENFQNRRN